MMALTIQEPWAWAIVDASTRSPDAKIVENRQLTFPRYAGPLLIHSGKGTRYKSAWDDCRDDIEDVCGLRCPDFSEIAGRGVIGVCHVVGTVPICELQETCRQHSVDYAVAELWAEGPLCLLLTDVAPFSRPIPFVGHQGLFRVPDELVRDAVADARERLAISREP